MNNYWNISAEYKQVHKNKKTFCSQYKKPNDLLISSTYKTDHHDIAEILLKMALNTINQPPNLLKCLG
jgi:hypothetical protein